MLSPTVGAVGDAASVVVLDVRLEDAVIVSASVPELAVYVLDPP
jgi:hypothetical protein